MNQIPPIVHSISDQTDDSDFDSDDVVSEYMIRLGRSY